MAHAVGDLALGQRLFVQLLAGVVVGSGSDEALQSDWVDVAWRGPGRVRLLQPQTAASPMHGWLDGRIGRLHHLRFTGVAESTLERLCAGHSVTALDNSRFELGPEHNLGVRLLLSA